MCDHIPFCSPGSAIQEEISCIPPKRSFHRIFLPHYFFRAIPVLEIPNFLDLSDFFEISQCLGDGRLTHSQVAGDGGLVGVCPNPFLSFVAHVIKGRSIAPKEQKDSSIQAAH